MVENDNLSEKLLHTPARVYGSLTVIKHLVAELAAGSVHPELHVCATSAWEAYNGTFHDPAQEKQVDVFNACGGGLLLRILQHLLHGCKQTHKERYPGMKVT